MHALTLPATPHPGSAAPPRPQRWTAQQRQAMAKVADWYTAADAQVFRLFGYAGVGKTSLANQIVEELGLAGRALFGAFTGKAASVLRAKGCLSADTIHSLIYQPTDKARERLKQLRERLEAEIDPAEQDMLARAIEAEQAKLEAPEFVLKEDSALSSAPLYVVDEVSMVGEKMAADILSFGTPVLVLGDPAQLPPVEGGGHFINAAPDVLLTEIHRSALDSPVTRISIAVRTAPHGDRWLGLTDTDGDSGRVARLCAGELLGFDQVLCGTNRTRWRLNTVIRALRGRTSPTPQPGDRIITLANNSAAEVLNGQQWTVTECGLDVRYPDVLHLEVTGEDGEGHAFDAWACGFADLKGEKLAKRRGRSRVAAATWGEAITVHKAQGSQWDDVLVVDESSVFSAMAYKEHLGVLGPDGAAIEGHQTARRWMYTAATRASQRVVVLGGPGGWA